MMVKTQGKGLFWYNKEVFPGPPPTTVDQMLAINPSQYGAQKLFCAAFESGTASGWPASDQIDNIIMRQNDATFYTNWIQGKVKFSDPQIKLGYQTFLKEVSSANVYGGAHTARPAHLQKGGAPPLQTPPPRPLLPHAALLPRHNPPTPPPA